MVFPAGDVIGRVTSAGRFSMTDAFAYKHPSQRTDLEILDITITWGWSSMRTKLIGMKKATGTHQIFRHPVDIRFSLQADITVIRDRCVEHLVEARTTAARVVRLELRCLNPLREQ